MPVWSRATQAKARFFTRSRVAAYCFNLGLTIPHNSLNLSAILSFNMAERGKFRGEPKREIEQPPYHQAAQFLGEQAEARAAQAYVQAQEIVYNDKKSDLSAYRLMLNAIYHVAILGEQPSQETDERIRVALSDGEPTTLPSDVLKTLNMRRLQMQQHGSWVEGHYRPGKRLK